MYGIKWTLIVATIDILQGLQSYTHGVKWLGLSGLLEHGWWSTVEVLSHLPLDLLYLTPYLALWITTPCTKLLEYTS